MPVLLAYTDSEPFFFIILILKDSRQRNDDPLHQLPHHLRLRHSNFQNLLMRHSRRLRSLHRQSLQLTLPSVPTQTMAKHKQRTSASNSSLTLLPPFPPTTPTTILVTKLSTRTLIPSSLAATTSGTVLIPTTEAPAPANNAPSPRVSYVGPLTHAYVPSASASRGRAKA